MMLAGLMHGHIAAQTPTVDPLDYQFTYSIIDSSSELSSLVAGIQNEVLGSDQHPPTR